MELDKRIIDGKKPLTCFEANQAKFFIGEKCYLTNDISIFANLDQFIEKEGCSNVTYAGVIDTLENIGTELSMPFETARLRWKFCLPCEWVKKEEPKTKYRPFSLNEFLERYKMGNTVTFRLKKGEYVPEAESLVEYQRMITGYEGLPEDRDKPGKGSILLGGCPPVSLARLFEFYELDNDFNWQPFGILEEE